MKTSGSAVWAFLLASTSLGQGVITFYNDGLIAADGEPYRAGVFRHEGFDPSQPPGVGAGDEYTAGLFLPSDLINPLATTTFRSTIGTEVFAKAQDVVIPGVPPGSGAGRDSATTRCGLAASVRIHVQDPRTLGRGRAQGPS